MADLRRTRLPAHGRTGATPAESIDIAATLEALAASERSGAVVTLPGA